MRTLSLRHGHQRSGLTLTQLSALRRHLSVNGDDLLVLQALMAADENQGADSGTGIIAISASRLGESAGINSPASTIRHLDRLQSAGVIHILERTMGQFARFVLALFYNICSHPEIDATPWEQRAGSFQVEKLPAQNGATSPATGLRSVDRAEEMLLIKKAQAGDADAMDRLITLCGQVIFKEAHRQRLGGVALEDLLQVGMQAAMKIIRAFNTRSGNRLITPLLTTIRNDVNRYIVTHRCPVKIPRAKQGQFREAELAEEQLAHELRRPPSDEELAHRLGTDPDWARTLRIGVPDLLSLDELAEEGAEVAAEDCDRADLRQMIDPFLNRLDATEQAVVMNFYGWLGPSMTIAELGASLGLPDDTVAAVKERAIDKLREPALVEALRPELADI